VPVGGFRFLKCASHGGLRVKGHAQLLIPEDRGLDEGP
jgi:hypothetical protein